MTPKKIAELAKEAGFETETINGKLWVLNQPKELAEFAELVATYERERCAEICDAAAEKEATQIAASSAYGGKQYTKEEFEQLKSNLSVSECAAAIRALDKDENEQ